MPTFLQPLLSVPAALVLANERTGEVVATHVEPAFESAARRRGLLGRDGLEHGHALVIAPCNAVHTWFMRFAIDIAFAARDGRVVKLRRGVRPWRMAFAVRAFATIEFPTGALDRTRIGDMLVLRPPIDTPEA